MPIKETKENPLFSKNIPPPPPPEIPSAKEAQETPIEKPYNQSPPLSAAPSRRPTRGQRVAEPADIELSLYLRLAHYDRLEELRREYTRVYRKKISANEVMRRLLEHATLDMLRPNP